MAFLQEYTMLDELGKGGFATVYKVRHNELGYIRAIRVLNETIVAKAGDDPRNSEAYRKFLEECKVLLRLGNGNHPNIVHIYKPNLLDNKALVEMDYVDGEDLFHHLDKLQDFIPAEEVVRMATQISSALAYCHEEIYRFCMDRDEDNLQDDPNDGTQILIDDDTRKRLIDKYKVIHNDIHSGNIMRRGDGNFVLLDFGLAINGDEVIRSSRRKNGGAPEFKAPEKWDDDATLTEQSDIYSFGIVMYQYLAGRVPFPYDKKEKSNYKAEFNLAEAHKKATPPAIEDIRRENFERTHSGEVYKRDYPQWLEEAILQCLRKTPAERFRNGKELYDFIMSHAQTANALCNDVEIENLNNENKNLASQLNGLRTTNKSLNDQLNSKQNECNSLALDLRNARDKIADLGKEITNLKNGKKSPWLVILIVLLGIWGVGVGIFAFSKENNEGNTDLARETDAVVVHDTIYQTQTKSNTKVVHDTIYQTRTNDAATKQIEDLNNQLRQKDAEYKKKVAELEEKNKQIAELKQKTPSTNNSTISSDLLKRKNDTIADFRKEIILKQNEIESLIKNISSKK